jgi:hypothetical protein
MSDNIKHLLVLEFDQLDGLIHKELRASLLDAGIDENVFAPVWPVETRPSGEEGLSHLAEGAPIEWFTANVPWVLDHLAEPALGIAALRVTRNILVEWIKAKAGRRVTLTVAGKKVDVHGSRDIDQCIYALEKISLSGLQKPKATRPAKTASAARKQTPKAALPERKS